MFRYLNGHTGSNAARANYAEALRQINTVRGAVVKCLNWMAGKGITSSLTLSAFGDSWKIVGSRVYGFSIDASIGNTGSLSYSGEYYVHLATLS